MVKKLMKQELIYYIRSLLPVGIILMGIAILGRVIHFFESDHWAYSIIGNASLAVFVISIIAALLMTTIFIVVRYYKNMFTGEGYLTLTLPVSFEQHLVSKLLTALLASFAVTIIVIAAVCVFLGGEWIIEIYKAANYLLKDTLKELGGHTFFYVMELMLLAIAGEMSVILNYYMCISLGQMFRKRKVLGAIAIYYGLYLITQIAVTVGTIIITVITENVDLTALEKWLDIHYRGMIHGCLLGGTLLSLALSAILFFVCQTILKKRLNLE